MAFTVNEAESFDCSEFLTFYLTFLIWLLGGKQAAEILPWLFK